MLRKWTALFKIHLSYGAEVLPAHNNRGVMFSSMPITLRFEVLAPGPWLKLRFGGNVDAVRASRVGNVAGLLARLREEQLCYPCTSVAA